MTLETSQTLQAYEAPGEASLWASRADSGLSRAEEQAIRLTGVQTGARILVIGCGSGRESLALSRAGFVTVGIDISRTLLASALAHAGDRPTLVYAAADATALPFRDGCFDQVLMVTQMFGQIPTRALRRKALAEARRIVRPTGAILVNIYTRSFRDYPLTYLLWRFATRRTSRRHDPGPTQGGATNEENRSAGPRRVARITSEMVSSRILRAWILLRSLRSKLMGASDGSGPRDLHVNPRVYRVRFSPAPGLIFYHLYTGREFIDDVRGAGLTVETMRSLRELNSDIAVPSLIRNLDFQHYYVLRRG